MTEDSTPAEPSRVLGDEGFAPDHFTELVGLVWDDIGPERLTAHLEVEEKHRQPLGIVHGGVYTTIVEVMASVGAFLNRPHGAGVPVGITNSTEFIRAHRSGRLHAEAKPVSRDHEHQLWDVEIRRTSDDKLVASGQVRLAAISPEQLSSTRQAAG